MKFIAALLSLVLSTSLTAQEKAPATAAFTVKGEVAKEITISLAEISSIKPVPLPDLEIRNHAGELKGVSRGMQGVLLRDLLKGVEFKAENPKVLSAFYLVLKASDGYTNVYSWNELFNSPSGDKVWVITSKEGKAIQDMPERILIANYGDLRSGRRYMKALAEIEVRRAGL